MDQFLGIDKATRSLLIGSILGDGEITIRYKNSRRKNHSYREHYGKNQKEYRLWKQQLAPQLLYMTPKSQTLRSKSSVLFTELYPHFYDKLGQKHIPFKLLEHCNMLIVSAIIYMDDGSLCISKRINHNQKKIFLSPHISLYLQCYSKDELEGLNKKLWNKLGLSLRLSKRKDGLGYIIKTTTIENSLNFLNKVEMITKTCPPMFYKTNWNYRFSIEAFKLKLQYPDYETLSSCSNRHRNYSIKEIEKLILLKQQKMSDQLIATTLGRSYWSVVYKIAELRKNGHLQRDDHQ
ncbi:DNA endonuclease [Fictibacillus sp. S7]|uniref:DNA endonuclease n=1 Tax=Fictibacillus sp. S7 TaxID=2212476 RepID=UPI00101057DB|nr:DNA endonuclease [Fictibacillus sp. S7]RXZ01853.1 DNA endonuclease [Fictibacillus sp. S7]